MSVQGHVPEFWSADKNDKYKQQ